MAAALVLGVVSLALGPHPGTAADRAVLDVTARSPLVVRGSHFGAGERVVVVAQVKGDHRKVVYATARGTFVLAFRTIRLENCATFVVRATGARGSYGVVRSPRECAPIVPPSG